MCIRDRPGTGVVEKRGGLLAVGAHEPLDQVLDVARLGQATPGQLVGQFGLTQSFVRLAGLFLGLLGFFPLNAPGLAGLGLLGLFGFLGLLALGLLGLIGLLLGGLLGVLGLPDGQVGHDLGLVLHDAADLLGLLADGTGQAAEQFGPHDGQITVDVNDLLHVLEV